MTDVTQFVEKMQALYGEPNEVQVQVVKEKLGQYDKAVFDAIVEHFILTRRYKNWPLPVEIIEAAADAKARLEPGKPWRPKVAPGSEAWTDERIHLANELICSELGVTALTEEWLEDLWTFCRKHCRKPDKHEAEAIKHKPRFANKMANSMAKVERDEGWRGRSYGIRTALVKLHRAMLVRAHEHKEMVQDWANGK